MDSEAPRLRSDAISANWTRAVFDDFGGDYIGIGKIGAVLEAFVFEPEDVEVEFVALGYLVVGETLEALGFFPLVARQLVGTDRRAVLFFRRATRSRT